MFNLSEKIQEFLIDVITDILNSTFEFLGEIIFNSEGLTGFFEELYGIFLACGAMLMVCIVLFKVIQGLLSTAANGESSQAQLGHIIVNTMKACVMIPIMPLLLWLVVGKIVYPLGEYMFSKVGGYTADSVSSLLKSGSLGEIIGKEFMFIVMFAFICVAVLAFLIKMCIYHADVLLLNVLSVLAAISIVADDNNYAGIWWREVLSQVMTIIVQTACMVGVVEILGSENLSWYQFMLLIGLCVLLIRGPSVLRNMWYATGSGKSMINQGGKMAARLMMVRKIFS